MKFNYERRPFRTDNLDEVIAFARVNHLPPQFPDSLLKRFLLDLVSSSDLVFDLFKDETRVATAVLLDRTQNGANSANLEILGLSRDEDTKTLFEMILSWAKTALPLQRSAVDVSYHESFPVAASVFEQSGFQPVYSMFDMKTLRPIFSNASLPVEAALIPVTNTNFDAYHELVARSFAENEDANITPPEEMRPYVLGAKIRPEAVMIDSQLIGFFSVKLNESEPDTGDVNTLGVLSEYRGRGFGRFLLEQAIRRLQENGAQAFTLSVSAVNERALDLYKSVGFEVADSSTIYRFGRSSIQKGARHLAD